jgi:hypothetical protein
MAFNLIDLQSLSHRMPTQLISDAIVSLLLLLLLLLPPFLLVFLSDMRASRIRPLYYCTMTALSLCRRRRRDQGCQMYSLFSHLFCFCALLGELAEV